MPRAKVRVAKRKPLAGACQSPAGTGIITPKQKREYAAPKPAGEVSIGVQNQGIRSKQKVDARQVEVIIELGDKPLGRRAKKAKDGPNTCSKQHH